MARTSRSELFEEDVAGCYHCTNRCVRRAFLCGRDPVSGKSYEHRKAWIRDRLEQLAAIFAIDVLDYAVLSNHFHLILRNRPDVVKQWSDKEVARRWWNLFPKRKDKNGQPDRPRDDDLKMLMCDPEQLKEIRRRLAHISWFMRCLAENIARRSNREDEVTGRFFQGRFRCQKLLDESALLACSMYVDLNPVRAGVARSPETSRYTSAYDRIRGRQHASDKNPRRKNKRRPRGRNRKTPDRWLSPLPLDTRASSRDRVAWRASNKGFLPLTLEEYLQLLDWTGRQVKGNRQSSIPGHLAPILDRLQIVSDGWSEMVSNFGRWFGTAAGRTESLTAEADRRGRRWVQGIQTSRTVFA